MKSRHNYLVTNNPGGFNKVRNKGMKELTFKGFKEQFCDNTDDLSTVGLIFVDLYLERDSLSKHFDFTDKLIYDPFDNIVSEIIGCIIFNIINENNEWYWEEMLSKIKFIAHDEPLKGEIYFDNFKESLVKPSQLKNKKRPLKKSSLKIKKGNIGVFVRDVYDAIKESLIPHP